MPITPFHFGLGAALHGAAPKAVSFIAFCAVNVFIDCESLYNLVRRRDPVHAFFHTYLGATLIAAALLGLFVVLRWLASRYWLPNILRWRDLKSGQVAVGALLGAWSHVVLDSVMHSDIRPLAPFSDANALHGALSLSDLHLLCVALAVIGLGAVGFRQWHFGKDKRR